MKHRKSKASVSILLCVLLMVSAVFSAVAETDPVADAQAKISAIGLVSYRQASLDQIVAAETAFGALDEAQQAQVTNADVLRAARAQYDRLAVIAADLKKVASFDTSSVDGWDHGGCDFAAEEMDTEGDHTGPHWVINPLQPGWSVWQGASIDLSTYEFSDMTLGAYVRVVSENEKSLLSFLLHNQSKQRMALQYWLDEPVVDLDNGEWVFIEIPFTDGADLDNGWVLYGEDHPFNMDSSIVTVEVRDLSEVVGAASIEFDGWALYNDTVEVQPLIDAANAVVDQIAAIGTITSAEQEAAVNEARAAYDELSETQQNLVVNADALKAAELALRQYKTASNVTSLITAIGEVSESNYKEKAKPIKDAREAYDNYHEKYEDDSLITNLQTLIDAETAYAGFVAAAKEDEIAALEGLIDAIGEVTAANSKEALPKIEAAEQARDALAETYGEEVLSEVSNLQKLEDARKAYDELNPDVKLGDVNKDTKIDATDALWVLQKTVGLKELSESEAAAADVDRSGEINATDALYILQMTVELITEFPTAK